MFPQQPFHGYQQPPPNYYPNQYYPNQYQQPQILPHGFGVNNNQPQQGSGYNPNPGILNNFIFNNLSKGMEGTNHSNSHN